MIVIEKVGAEGHGSQTWHQVKLIHRWRWRTVNSCCSRSCI